MRFAALDLETAPEEGQPQVYALQPWRVKEGRAKITSLAVSLPDEKPSIYVPEEICKIDYLANKSLYTVTWNGIFDIAWLLASGHEWLVKNVQWVDGMLLWKWLENSQYKEKINPDWSLVAATRHFLKHERWCNAYIKMKKDEPPAGEKDQYWILRAQYDALATRLIAEAIWPRLSPQQQHSALIEAQCLVPVAESWVRGVEVDAELARRMTPEITQEMEDIEMRLGVHTAVNQPIWTPSKILSSPKQLSELLYEKWGLPCEFRTPTGAPASNKAALTYLADIDDHALSILRWRELNTQYTKFIKGIGKVGNYLGSDTTHAQPRLFSTYTGRMTYSSKSGQKGDAAKAFIGVPLHQWPRPKPMRKLIKAPPGKALVEFDAAGQEMRFMACKSMDPVMLRVFNAAAPYDDIHSYMGSQLAGISFEAFLKGKEDGVPAIVGPTGYRYQGKFSNLSCQYRIGARSLRIKSRVDYGMDVDIYKTKSWQRTYKYTYKGIPRYWDDAIKIAKQYGYAETLGGRRYELTDWGGDYEFGTGQSAINFPIQGSGGDQKELGLATLTQKFPELQFTMDLHDGLYFYADINQQLPELLTEARATLNNLDYEKHWNYKPPIPLLWDCSVGKTWGSKKDLK